MVAAKDDGKASGKGVEDLVNAKRWHLRKLLLSACESVSLTLCVLCGRMWSDRLAFRLPKINFGLSPSAA